MLTYVTIFCFVVLGVVGVWYYKVYQGPSVPGFHRGVGKTKLQGFELLAVSDSLTPGLKEYLLELEPAELAAGLSEMIGEMSPELVEETASLLISEEKWDEILDLTEDANAQLRENTAEILGYLPGPGGSKTLVTALGDKNEAVRLTATASLIKLRDPETAELLAQALAHPGKLIPARVAEVLLALEDKAVPPLMEAIQEAEEEGQPLIIEVLGQLEDSESVSILTEILQESPWDKSRAAAATALGNLPHGGQESALIAALEDPYWEVRAKAAEALASLQNYEAREALQRVAETDEDWNVQVVAQAALKRIAQNEDPVT